MRPSALIGALVGAALGALIWAGIATWTGLEIGWVAWGVGGLVGFGAAVLGGAGTTTGGVRAVLALVSIFAGKWIATDAIAEREIRELVTLALNHDAYKELRSQASDFATITSESDYPEFMIVHGYTAAEYEDEVPAAELIAFRMAMVPELRKFQRTQPSYAQFKEQYADEAVAAWSAEISTAEVVKENLSGFDFLFGILGLVTAFQIGARGMGSAAFGAAGTRAAGDTARAPGMHPSRYGDVSDGFATPATDAPILRDEPPNPYAHPGPAAQPASREPAAPFQPRTIGRLEQQPEEAGSRNPYA